MMCVESIGIIWELSVVCLHFLTPSESADSQGNAAVLILETQKLVCIRYSTGSSHGQSNKVQLEMLTLWCLDKY